MRNRCMYHTVSCPYCWFDLHPAYFPQGCFFSVLSVSTGYRLKVTSEYRGWTSLANPLPLFGVIWFCGVELSVIIRRLFSTLVGYSGIVCLNGSFINGKSKKYQNSLQKGNLVCFEADGNGVVDFRALTPYSHIVFKVFELTVQLWQYPCCPKILTMAGTPKFHSGKAQYWCKGEKVFENIVWRWKYCREWGKHCDTRANCW